MNGSFILEGITMILIIVAGVGIIWGIVYLFKRNKNQINHIFYQNTNKSRDFTAFQETSEEHKEFISSGEFNHLKSRINDLENRIEKLERITQPIISCQKQETPKSGVFHKTWQDNEPSLLNEFLTEMVGFVDNYRKSKLEVKPRQILTEREKAPEVIPTPLATAPEKKYKPINDINLIKWWRENGYGCLSACKESLKEEFGKVFVELIKGQGDNWNLIAVSNDRANFYILPRKTGWEDRIYQDWFTLEEGTVRPGEPIRTLNSPLPKAKKELSGWQIVGKKGKVSIKESGYPLHY